MKIETTKYVIATDGFPILFENDEACDTDNIEEAAFYNDREAAEYELERFDEPKSRVILTVKVTYEL